MAGDNVIGGNMEAIAHIIGVAGIIAFVISYQQRTRKGIIISSIIARGLFIAQYVLLGAYEGAIMNFVGNFSAILAENKEKSFIKKNRYWFVGIVYITTILSGILTWESAVSFLPVIAMLLQNTALWATRERTIRILSLLGLPFWFSYNTLSGAYTSMISDIFCATSLIVALIRYDMLKKKE